MAGRFVIDTLTSTLHGGGVLVERHLTYLPILLFLLFFPSSYLLLL